MNRHIDAIVLDGTERSALAIVRSLGAHGVRVAVAADSRVACAAASTYCHDAVRVPPMNGDPRAVADELLQYVRRSPDVVLLPNTDRGHIVLYERLEEFLAAGARVAVPPLDLFTTVGDKLATARIAKRLGIPVPATHVPESRYELDRIADSLRYPVAIKARTSTGVRQGRVRLSALTRYARNPAELRRIYALGETDMPNPIVQEYVCGHGVGVSLLCQRGRPLMRFAHRRIRDAIPTGSSSAVRESIPYPHRLGEYAERLAATLNWTGPMMGEFRHDP